jgi:hypothetical protein
MAQAIERSQMGAMRANQIQKCQSPEYKKTIPTWCSSKKVQRYVDTLGEVQAGLRHLHQNLYLVRQQLPILEGFLQAPILL